MRFSAVLLLGILVLLAPAASASLVPDSAAQLRIVSRDGVTFSVEVTNPTEDLVRVDPIGLYFIPEQPGDDSQRLGVVTAGGLADGVLHVAPHRSVTFELVTYCIDEKREAPKGSSKYRLASRRMPTALTRVLAGAALTVASRHDYDLTQDAIWRARAAMPVVLVGDRRSAE